MVKANESLLQNPFSTLGNYIITFENIELKAECEGNRRMAREGIGFSIIHNHWTKTAAEFFMALLFL
jgi:hypothetical protein